MKRLALAVICLFAAAPLAHAEIEFEGSLCLTAVTTACQPDWQKGSCFLVRYAPRSIGSNGPDTELSLFGRTFAVGFKLPSGNPVAATPYTVSMAKVARGGYSYNLGFRFASQTPSAPLATSPSITFTGAFTNWDEITGCTVTFRGATTLRP